MRERGKRKEEMKLKMGETRNIVLTVEVHYTVDIEKKIC